MSAGLDLCRKGKTTPSDINQQASVATTSMRTPGMAVFKEQNVEDFYEIGEELGR